VLQEQGREELHVVAVAGGEGDDLDEVQQRAVLLDRGEDLRLGHAVDLVDGEDHRTPGLREHVAHVAVAGAVGLGDVDDPHREVHLAQASHRRLHHALVHPVHRLVDARRVEEDDLPSGRVDDGQDPVARGLGLVGDDRHLLPHQPVHQRRLPDVGSSDDGDEPGVEGGSVRGQ
jgi:hypothetical protein